jgi:hypothetical protein
VTAKKKASTGKTAKHASSTKHTTTAKHKESAKQLAHLHTLHVEHEAHLAHLKAIGKAVTVKATPAKPAKAFAVGDWLPVCSFEAVAMSLRLAGQPVHGDEVAELWELTGSPPQSRRAGPPSGSHLKVPIRRIASRSRSLKTRPLCSAASTKLSPVHSMP